MTNQLNDELRLQLIKTQVDLLKSQEELAALKGDYQEFTYIVSHDLSAPLRQIEGFSEIILSKYADEFDDKTKNHFDLIIKGTKEVKDNLSALLNYSRINTKAEAFVEIDFDTIITENKERLSKLINESVAVINHENMPLVIGDKTQITEMFYHLLHNALYYQPKGNIPVIDIKAIEVEGYWQFCITDNGIGIADNFVDKLFKVFRRGVSKKQFKGIGMGLSFTKKVLERHKGSIWFESKKGQGASFYFTLKKDLSNE